jgi:dethiobiotin synthetase
MSILFITGTDTDAGKTVATCQMLRAFAANGLRAVGMKPVASGCEWRDGALWNADVAAHRAAGNVAAPLEWMSPYRFEPPISPHLAARRVGVEVDLEHLLDCARRLEQQADVVVVEGAGGWLAPLSDSASMEDLARKLGAPVVLVVGMRLGCLNHALLTARAISQSGVPFAGWIANQIDPAMLDYQDNLDTLRRKLLAPCLGQIKHGSGAENLALAWESLAAGLEQSAALIRTGSAPVFN